MKTLNFLSAGENAPLADCGLQFSKTMLAENIEKHEFFEKLFKIDDEVLERIADSMRKNGFDKSQPLHVWHTKGKDGADHWYLIDGYTRFAACKNADISRIPVTVHENFSSTGEAYKYALSLQVNRRNLSGDELLKNVAILLDSEIFKNFSGDKAGLVAESFGVSRRTAQRAISLGKNGDESLLRAVESGELSMNQAYDKMQSGRSLSEKKTVKKAFAKDLDNKTVTSSEIKRAYHFTEESLLKIIFLVIQKTREGFSEDEIIKNVKNMSEGKENGLQR